MKEEQDNELDRVFRKGLRNYLDTPTPIVWNNLRVNLIEQRLYTAEQQNKRLKIGIGSMGLIIIVLSSLLCNEKKIKPIKLQPKIVYKVVSLHDTVYVPHQSKTIGLPKQIIANAKIRQEKNDSDENLSKVFYKNIDFDAKKVDNQANVLPLEPASKFILFAYKSIDSVDKLVNLPEIQFHSKQSSNVESKTKPRKLSFRNPSIQFFYASEISQVPMETNGSVAAITIDKERHYRAFAYGGNLSFELSPKLSIKSGLAYSYTEFKPTSNIYERPLVAETYNGSPNFVYKTAFGVVMIPTELLSVKPSNTNSIMIANEEKHILKQLRIPLLFNYQIFDSQKTFGGNPSKLKVYQAIGAELKLNRSQSLKVEINELNGHNFYTTFTKFKESSATNWGIILGAGFEYRLSPKVNFYFEPTIHLSTTSYSQNQLVKSYPRWWSFASGLKYSMR